MRKCVHVMFFSASRVLHGLMRLQCVAYGKTIWTIETPSLIPSSDLKKLTFKSKSWRKPIDPEHTVIEFKNVFRQSELSRPWLQTASPYVHVALLYLVKKHTCTLFTHSSGHITVWSVHGSLTALWILWFLWFKRIRRSFSSHNGNLRSWRIDPLDSGKRRFFRGRSASTSCSQRDASWSHEAPLCCNRVSPLLE